MLIAIISVIAVLAIGAALQGIVFELTQDIEEPFRTIFRLPFDFIKLAFRVLVPFLR